jgi:hypothetical protein
MGDKQLHEFLLLEESAGERQRADSPVSFAVLQTQSYGETYNIVVSYQSMYLRWFQVSLTTAKLQSQVALTALVTHLTLLEWQSSSLAAPPIEKPSGLPGGPKRRVSIQQKAFASDSGSTQRRESLKPGSAQAGKDPESNRTAFVSRPSVLAPILTNKTRRSSLIIESTPPTSSSARRASRLSIGNSRGESPQRNIETDRIMANQQSLCIIAFDVAGGMPMLLARGAKIAKVYTCSDHFGDKSAKVDQLICDGKIIAVQVSNGDIRHVEFVVEDDQVTLKDIPMDLPT